MLGLLLRAYAFSHLIFTAVYEEDTIIILSLQLKRQTQGKEDGLSKPLK